MLITYSIVCCESKPVGRIDDRRAIGSGVTIWSPIAPARWRDRAENTIRCNVCRKSAQLSAASAALVSDLLAPQMDQFTPVRVTDPDGHDRNLADSARRAVSHVKSISRVKSPVRA
jgi:hypothetical protein